jgi:hypothetical protein
MDFTKIKRSAVITLGGMVVTIVPVLTSEIIDYIANNNPVDLRTSLVLAIGAFSTWCVNTAKVIINSYPSDPTLETEETL